MDYPEAISRLLTLVDHERNAVSGPRQKAIYDLSRIESLLDCLGKPQCKIPAIHVAGTKGKGSTAALCDAALKAAGVSTGFYSSPHLHTFRERIRRNSEPVSPDIFAGLVEGLWPIHEEFNSSDEYGPLTLFEYLTAMAFQYFADDKVDAQVIEVGLGGKLDATNVLDAGVCVITSISMDHMAILGDTIQEIAADKAGIIKPGSTVVVAPQSPEALEPILTACKEKDASPILVGRDVTWENGSIDTNGQRFRVRGLNGEYDLFMPLLGSHQLENASSAVAALESMQSQGFEITSQAIEVGFEQVRWPCRMEILSRSPLLMADGAHNVYSVENLLQSLPRYLNYDKLIAVVGFSRDKDIEGMARALDDKADSVFASISRHPRSLAVDEVVGLFKQSAVKAPTVPEALRMALESAGKNDLVLATGSLFFTAEVRESVLGIEPEIYSGLFRPTSKG